MHLSPHSIACLSPPACDVSHRLLVKVAPVAALPACRTGLWAVLTWIVGALHVAAGNQPLPSVNIPPSSLFLKRVGGGVFPTHRGFYVFETNVSSILFLGFVSYKKTFHHFETVLKIVLFYLVTPLCSRLSYLHLTCLIYFGVR